MYVYYLFASQAHRGQTQIYSFIVIATFISQLMHCATLMFAKLS